MLECEYSNVNWDWLSMVHRHVTACMVHRHVTAYMVHKHGTACMVHRHVPCMVHRHAPCMVHTGYMHHSKKIKYPILLIYYFKYHFNYFSRFHAGSEFIKETNPLFCPIPSPSCDFLAESTSFRYSSYLPHPNPHVHPSRDLAARFSLRFSLRFSPRRHFHSIPVSAGQQALCCCGPNPNRPRRGLDSNSV